jgi:hypothetical protein
MEYHFQPCRVGLGYTVVVHLFGCWKGQYGRFRDVAMWKLVLLCLMYVFGGK